MTETTAASGPSPSGIDRARVVALLERAEPDRLAALSASLNLILAIALTIGGRAALDGHLVQPLVGIMIAIALWRLINRLWRDRAVGMIAPALGAAWGQSQFSSGWAAVPLEDGLRDFFSGEGARLTSWQSCGRYRDIDYRLSEATIRERNRKGRRPKTIHLLTVQVAVPKSFQGSVEIAPGAGFMSKVEEVLRQWTGSSEQHRDIDPAFDAVFDTTVTADAPVDDLLTPGFREAMLRLAARYPRLSLMGRFEHGWFSLRLPIPHLVFSSAKLLTPMRDLAHDADALWWDLTVPHRLIDALTGEHDGPLR